MKHARILSVVALGFAGVLAACGSQEAAANDATPTAAAQQEAASTPAPAAPAAAGNVVEVKLVMDGANNYFEPKDVVVNQGDVVRFVLVSGVHNVSFPAQNNAGATGLPAPSSYLATPGQTFDVTADFGPGTYNFQCDPHVMMGMVGTLTVK